MSIVYELGDSAMKQNLVNALVGTLTGSGKRKRAIKVCCIARRTSYYGFELVFYYLLFNFDI